MQDARYWDDVAHQVDKLPAGWRRHARSAHIDLVRRWVGSPAGRWLKTDLQEELHGERRILDALEGEWLGIDISAAAVSGSLRSSRLAAGVVADVRALPLASGSFDGVLSTSTLDHFATEPDLHTALRELRRVLAPPGILVLTLDNRANPLVRLRNALPRRIADLTRLVPFFVGVTFDDRTGRAALRAAGFEVQQTAHLLHAPHVIGTRLARWRWWEQRALPMFDRLGETRIARRTGHFVCFKAVAS